MESPEGSRSTIKGPLVVLKFLVEYFNISITTIIFDLQHPTSLAAIFTFTFFVDSRKDNRPP